MTNNGSPFYVGVVEDRNDHLTLGRCKVRVVGLHTQDKTILPTRDLPWAALMMPANSAGTSGVGVAPIGPVEGSTVMVMFNDPPYNQQPIVVGALQGIPQQQSIINDTLDITALYQDDIGSAGRDIPVNYEQATALQSTPFDPGSFINTDPYNLMLAIKQQSIGFAAVQLSISFPGIDLKIGEDLAFGLYGEVQFFPGDISVFSGAVDAMYQLTGAIGNVYGAVNQAYNNVVTAFNAITQGVTISIGGIDVIIQPPIISVELLPQLFNYENNDPVILAARAELQLQIKNSTGGILSGIKDISQWEQCTLSPFDWEGFIRLGLNPPNSIENIKEWAKKCLPVRCLEQLEQVVTDCIIRNILTPENVVPCILTWIVKCLAAGGGQYGGNSTLQYTVEAASLFATINLEEIWSEIEGVALDAAGKVTGLIEGLTGFPQGITTAAMVVADSVDSAITGVAKAATAFAEVPIKELVRYAKTGEAVMSVSYPAWTLIAGHCKPLENPPPPPSGLFAEAGRAAINALVSPLPHVNFNIVLTPPRINNSQLYGVASSSASGGSDIPTDPPPQFAKSAPDLRKEGIEALLKAAEKIGGLDTREQKCSLLSIAGGECQWIPIDEPHIWSSPDHLMSTFFSAFRGDRGIAEKYANWQGDKKDFFEFVYSYKNDKGKDLGNREEGDGGKFYGRGFIQIVGRALYEKYAAVSGYDIVKTPELLVSDVKIAAEVAVYYFKDQVQQTVPPGAHPGYLEASIKELAGYFSDKDTIRSYYDYFYGLPSVENLGVALKEAGPESPSSYSGRMGHQIENGRLPKSNQNLYLGRETGFVDPHNKYPLKPNLHRPDTNPLARGAIKESIVPLKEARRTRGIRLPFGKGVVDQPQPAYAAVYPYNHVMETESGHIQEFDDTPGAERIHTYHRSGTFTEIDSGGNQVNKIVGDKYTIIDKNGIISVEGEATISAVGNINIYCKSNVNIQSEGSMHIESGGNLDIKVAKDLQISAGGKIKMWSTGGNYLHTDKTTHIFSKDEFYNLSVNRLANVTAGNWYAQSEKVMNFHSKMNTFMYAEDILDIYSRNRLSLDADSNVAVHAKSQLTLYPAPIISPNGIFVEAAKEDKMRFPPEPISTASIGNPVKHRSAGADLVAPTQSTSQGQRYHYETPDDYNTPGGQAVLQSEQKQQGQYNQFKGESYKETTGGVDKPSVPLDTVDNFSNPESYTNDYRLSTHITLGMMLVDNVKLVPQNGLTVQEIVRNLACVAENIIEPLITENILSIGELGKVWGINSGFRVGVAQKGKKLSQHNLGQAVDFGYIRGTPNRRQRIFELVKKVEKVIAYDQLIFEYDGPRCWIHASYNPDGNQRKSAFTMNAGKVVGQGFILLAD